MKKKNIIIITIIVIFALLGLGALWVSYGYVTSDIINQGTNGKYYVVENLRIEYSDGTETLTSNQENVFIPGSVITKTFTVKNTGNKDLNFNILFGEIINNFNRKQDITFEIYYEENLLASGLFPNDKVNYIVGDVNLDEIVNIEDYNKLKAFFDGTGSLNHMQMIAADLNLDNTIDEKDSPSLLKEYIDSISSEETDKENDLISNIGSSNTTANFETIVDNQFLKIDESKSYTLKIKYLTSEENQIEDSGKTINAKITFEQMN